MDRRQSPPLGGKQVGLVRCQKRSWCSSRYIRYLRRRHLVLGPRSRPSTPFEAVDAIRAGVGQGGEPVEGLFTVLMCADCRAARGHASGPQVKPYVRPDSTKIWSLMQLERQLRPQAYRRRRGGDLDRRQTPAADRSPIRSVDITSAQAH
jgi:hypothetical protein